MDNASSTCVRRRQARVNLVTRSMCLLVLVGSAMGDEIFDG